MEKENSKIRVVDTDTRQILFECALDESEKAYQFAAGMEEMGLSVEVMHPTLSETLTDSLGLSNEERRKYEASLEEEIEHHEGSCCFEDPSDKKVH
jgi:hypothetical protein